jgi:hypothetical protein
MKQLWESSKATIQQLVANKLELENNAKRNEVMAIEVVRHLYFSIKLDGSGNKDGSFIYLTFLEWGHDTFSNCGFHTFESMHSKDLGKKTLWQLNTDNGTRRGSHLVVCVKRVAHNSTMYRAQFTASVEAICKSEFQPTVFIIGPKYVSHSSQIS